MTSYTVKIEGQVIPLPEEIAKDDEGVKRALAPYYPEAANAMITRVEKDGNIEITVVKRAGTKGLLPLQHLVECPEGRNSAIELNEQIVRRAADGDLTPLDLLELEPLIDTAIQDGKAQAEAIEGTLKRLTRSAAQPAPVVITGF
ncbi:MAG TPA: hypothetical protein VN364_08250 [Bellilinea sp.]|nr:hypothetical protein [Bellilinea sp.]